MATQRETWAIHAAAGALITIGMTLAATPILTWLYLVTQDKPILLGGLLGVWTTSVWFFSREVRDHEVKHGIPAREWYVGLRFWEWNTDGKMDLASPVIAALVVLLAVYELGVWS